MTAIQISDLNTTINHEPRVRDLLIAERLGLADPHKIRPFIEANRPELETYGEVSARRAETSALGGRPGTEYWLNEGQALVICALSRTPKAAAVRKALIDVYLEYRNGGKKVPVRAHLRRVAGTAPAPKPRASAEEQRKAIMAIGECLLEMLNAKDKLNAAVAKCDVKIDDSLFESAFNDVWRQLRRPLIATGTAPSP